MRRWARAGLATVAAVTTACGGGNRTVAATHPPAQPGAPASTSSPRSATPSRDALTRTDWARLRYPFDCAPFGYLVLRVRYADLNGDGLPDAVVLVRCDAGAGSPPVALYVFDGASPPGSPRVMATLMSPDMGRIATDVAVTDTTVTVDAYGYSSEQVARCCPDQQFRMRWHWHGATYDVASTRLS